MFSMVLSLSKAEECCYLSSTVCATGEPIIKKLPPSFHGTDGKSLYLSWCQNGSYLWLCFGNASLTTTQTLYPTDFYFYFFLQ